MSEQCKEEISVKTRKGWFFYCQLQKGHKGNHQIGFSDLDAFDWLKNKTLGELTGQGVGQ